MPASGDGAGPAPGAAPRGGPPPGPADGPPSPADPSPHLTPARYLTADVPGTGGTIRDRADDFLVEEIPAYEPSGTGEHLYLFVEKRDMSTMHLARLAARHFGVRPTDVGYAGLKDKRAVTRQLISVWLPGRDAASVPAITHDHVRVLWMDRHGNKLRRGHLAGNRFSIRIRGVAPTAATIALRTLRALERAGVPNRFGEQRFGRRGQNHLVGRALVLGHDDAAIDHLLGPAGPADRLTAVHERFARGDYAGALEACPKAARTERVVLGELARGRSAHQAVRAVDPAEKAFFVSALQSAVFNAVLDDRLARGGAGSLEPGDIAWKHENGACFAVAECGEDLAARAGRLEVSPTGPMWGSRMMRPEGGVLARELAALLAAGLAPSDLENIPRSRGGPAEGVRRPMRVPLSNVDVEGGVDDHGAYVRCAFDLPRGAFATTVLAEVMKSAPGDGPEDEDE